MVLGKKFFYWLLFFFIFLSSISMSGCKAEKYDDTKIADLEYTVVPEQDIPSGVKDIIENSKNENVRKTYLDQDYLYIIICYGPQPTTGYSISIEDIYEAEKAIFVSSMLKGPSKTEKAIDTVTYPYLVLKLKYNDKAVIFH